MWVLKKQGLKKSYEKNNQERESLKLKVSVFGGFEHIYQRNNFAIVILLQTFNFPCVILFCSISIDYLVKDFAIYVHD
jgi:hypothetical protein